MVKVLSMKEPPSHTFAYLLGDLYAIPGEFVACLEWQRMAGDRVRRRRHPLTDSLGRSIMYRNGSRPSRWRASRAP